ncbi:MAG: phosphatidate cytidylyltransferase [Nostocoides sp.]
MSSKRRVGGRRPSRHTSRAGRDLGAAIGVGVGLSVLVLASLLIDRRAFLVVLCAAVGVGVWEMSRAVAAGGIRVAIVPVLVGVLSMNVAAYVRGGEALTVTFGLTVLATIVWRTADGVAHAIGDISGSVLVTIYPGFLAGFAAMMLAAEDGATRIIFFIFVTVASDIGGYAVGVLAGRHPMAPTVSPKKSWEGFAGSVLASAVVAAGLGLWFFEIHPALGAVVGAVVAAIATLGDLTESLIKRDLGVKDMGTLLPGHGGVMDRLDSLVLTAPVIWAFLFLTLGGR